MDHPTALEFNTPAATEPRTLPDPASFHSLGEVVDAAKADARQLAGEAAPKLKQAIRTVAYDVVYGATFGACFAAAFAREVAPGALKDGIARGAQAGREAARRAKAAFTVPPQPATPAAPVECPATA
jgi:hypothetical protein